MKQLIAITLFALTAQVWAQATVGHKIYNNINYIGGGRYTCSGECDDFDREQKNRNRDVEMRERIQCENRQDSQRIIDELKKGN